MENQIFNSSRFISFLRKTLIQQKSFLVNTLLVLALFPLAFSLGLPYIKNYYSLPAPPADILYNRPLADPMWENEVGLFSFLWILVCILCCNFFSPLSKKTERIDLFTNPASNVEKFLSFFLIYAILFPVAMSILVIFADAIRVWVFSALNPECKFIHYISPQYLFSFGCAEKYLPLLPHNVSGVEAAELKAYLSNISLVKFSAILFGGILLQSLYGLGCAVWPQKSGLKTSVYLMAMVVATGTLFFIGVKVFYGINGHLIPRSWGIDDSHTQIFIIDVIITLIAISTWIISYFRFKEWEVIKRW